MGDFLGAKRGPQVSKKLPQGQSKKKNWPDQVTILIYNAGPLCIVVSIAVRLLVHLGKKDGNWLVTMETCSLRSLVRRDPSCTFNREFQRQSSGEVCGLSPRDR